MANRGQLAEDRQTGELRNDVEYLVRYGNVKGAEERQLYVEWTHAAFTFAHPSASEPAASDFERAEKEIDACWHDELCPPLCRRPRAPAPALRAALRALATPPCAGGGD
eukprot:gene6379-9157_t